MKKKCGRRPVPAAQRFWANVEKHDKGCWLWIGNGKHKFGYGKIYVDGRHMNAHRFSYELHNGPIPDGLWVLHHCDVPECVRPDHLFLGTGGDNIHDCIKKNRRVISRGHKNPRRPNHPWRMNPELVPKGEAHPRARLTEQDVRQIRAEYVGHSPTHGAAALAAKYGTSPGYIGNIVAGKSWKHIIPDNTYL
jgi:hypothetical protein